MNLKNLVWKDDTKSTCGNMNLKVIHTYLF